MNRFVWKSFISNSYEPGATYAEASKHSQWSGDFCLKIQPLPPAFLFDVSDIPTLWSLNTIQHSTSQPTFYAE